MLKHKKILLVPGIVLGTLALTAAEKPQVKSTEQTALQAHVGRQATLRECEQMIRQANDLLKKQEFRAAIAKYIEAKKILTTFAGGEKFKDKIKFCEDRIKDSYYRMAEQAMSNADDFATSNDFEAAIKLCREAQKYCPERREELAQKIVFYEKRRDAAIFHESTTTEKLLPNASAQEYQIQLTLEKGRRFAKEGQLAKAKQLFEQVLLIDPYNADALQDLLGVNTRLKDQAKRRYAATARHMTGQVLWAPAIPIVPDAPVGNPENQIGTPVEKKVENDDLITRLRNIRIKDFTIEEGETTFNTLMEQLSEDARKFDKSKQGITFVIKTKPVATQEQSAAQDSDADGQQTAKQAAAEPTLPYFSEQDCSVYDLLCKLQSKKFLTFKVEKNAVFVAAPGEELEKLTVRRFPLEISPDTTQETLESELKSLGIPFPEGSFARPIKERSHIIVKNTPENMKKIESALPSLSLHQPMVQIMFKFLEVNQNDLDELAFNWQYSSNMKDNGFHVSSNSNELLRHYALEDKSSDDYSGKAVGGNTDDATYNIYWQDSNNALQFSVYALDWADNNDVLYSPRVTTLSGVTASIDMSEKHFYPSEWETIDTDTNNDFYVRVDGAQPTLDDEQDLGVKFQITPEVTGHLISAQVNIPIKQFASWLIVDTRTSDTSSDDDGEYIKKPIFNQREINTFVTLKDGETVLIGSICEDLQEQTHDKIPILGDLPVVGRLFQSKYTTSKKVNLLVFMSCKLIKPDGSAQYPENEINVGLPTFPRNQ